MIKRFFRPRLRGLIPLAILVLISISLSMFLGTRKTGDLGIKTENPKSEPLKSKDAKRTDSKDASSSQEASGSMSLEPHFMALDDALKTHAAAGNDFENLESAFVIFLEDEHIDRAFKMRILWELSKRYAGGPYYEYILDQFASLYPIEFSDDVMRAFESTSDSREKTKLLMLLSDSTAQTSGRGLTERELEEFAPNMERIQNFILAELASETNPELREALQKQVDAIFPPDTAYDLLEESRLEAVENGNDALAVAMTLSALDVALSNEQSQKRYLVKTLDLVSDSATIFTDEGQRMAFASRIENAKLTSEGREEIKKRLPAIAKFYDDKATDAYLYVNMIGQTQGASLNPEDRKKFFASQFATGSVNQRIGILMYEDTEFLTAVDASRQELIFNELIELKATSSDNYLSTALSIACEKAQGPIRQRLMQRGHCDSSSESASRTQAGTELAR